MVHGDTYLFAYDMKANVLLNPAFPQREGTNVTGQKDAKGKLLHQAIIDTTETKGSGWVDYWFPKPGQTEPSHKWTYVKRVTIDGVPGLIASGFSFLIRRECGQACLTRDWNHGTCTHRFGRRRSGGERLVRACCRASSTGRVGAWGFIIRQPCDQRQHRASGSPARAIVPVSMP